MRKKIIVAALILLALILIAARAIIAPSKGTVSYPLEGKEYMLLTARTPQEWEKGLMDVRGGLDNADGMLFIFPDKSVRTFWNKNTFVDLDVYWVDNDKVVGKSFLPSVEKQGIVQVSSERPVDKVVEIIK